MDQKMGMRWKYKKSRMPSSLLNQEPMRAPINPKTMLVKHPRDEYPASAAPIDPQTAATRSSIKKPSTVMSPPWMTSGMINKFT